MEIYNKYLKHLGQLCCFDLPTNFSSAFNILQAEKVFLFFIIPVGLAWFSALLPPSDKK